MPGMGSNFFNVDPVSPRGEVTLGPVSSAQPQFRKIEDLLDGTSIYEINDEIEVAEKDEKKRLKHHENLADSLDDSILQKISGKLLEGIQQDISSRSEWEAAFNKGMDYLGFKVQEFRDYPFSRCCSVFDSTLATALLRFWSTARAELFPAKGPANYEIHGESTEELENQGGKVMKFLNHYLTKVDKDYYPDSERLLMYLGIVGCAFRKVYTDPMTERPKARFIDPQDFIVNNLCRSILSSDRLTHAEYLSKREVMLREKSGYFRDVELPDSDDDDNFDSSDTTKVVKKNEGITPGTGENKSLFKFYEVHTDLDLDGFEDLGKDSKKAGMPLPYIVTICVNNKRIVSIRRNWIEGDPLFNRIEYFVQYNYLPGFGIYGIGLAQLLGSNAIALTSILRQLVDSGTLKNFPGGLKAKGLRVENNNKAIGPSEFWDVETGGMPIRDAIMLMPYAEPSQVLKELRNEIIQQTQQIAGTAETQIPESNAETPVGTTLAMIEVANKVQSSVLRSLHMSLGHELELLYKLFSENITPHEFLTQGNIYQISSEDFNENIKIIPVSDPNLTTSTQRILRAEAILRLAQSAPELHDMRNAYHRMYSAMNVSDIEALLIPEKNILALDPITENMNAMENKPLKADIWQDHASHIIVHTQFLEQNPDMEAQMMEHIHAHRAYEYLLQMQVTMQIQMPPLEQLQNPELQNDIAMKAAQAAAQLHEQHQQNNPKPPDPNEVMLADIEARREATIMKERESKLRAETESYKAMLKFQSDKEKLEIQQEMAEDKIEAELEIEQLKQEYALKLQELKIKHEARKGANSGKG